jgi:BCD family chlorophyll transporter-like MFS transporter
MQDILLEPYGGEDSGYERECHHDPLSNLGHGHADRLRAWPQGVSGNGTDPIRLAGYGAVLGLFAFAAVILAAPLQSPLTCSRPALASSALAAGFFAVGTLTSAMALGARRRERTGPGRLGRGAGHRRGTGDRRRRSPSRLSPPTLPSSGRLGPGPDGRRSPAMARCTTSKFCCSLQRLIALGPLVRGQRQVGRSAASFALHDFPS